VCVEFELSADVGVIARSEKGGKTDSTGFASHDRRVTGLWLRQYSHGFKGVGVVDGYGNVCAAVQNLPGEFRDLAAG
jgi:hypothetical protein